MKSAGFTGNDSPTKLPYLERALQRNPKDQVFNSIKKMTQREFAEYAKSGKKNVSGNEGEDLCDCETITNWGHSFSYRGKEAARVNKKLPRKILKMLLPAIRLSFNALDKKSYVVAVHLKNYKEYEKFQDIAIAAREKMRIQMSRSI